MPTDSFSTPAAVRVLHTSDWHVGRRLRGRDRGDEHRAVLGEITSIASDNEVDLVLLAGDVFETASPSAESETIVYETLASLARDSRIKVAVIAGNHDHPDRLQAVSQPFSALGVHMRGFPSLASGDGVLHLEAKSGVGIRVAMLPFVHRKRIVKASQLMGSADHDHTQVYRDRIRVMLEELAGQFQSDTANLMMAHAFVGGDAIRGAGEREIHFTEDYRIDADAIPPQAGYVGLGHLHSPQQVVGAPNAYYCGTPMHLDFGHRHTRQVNLIDIDPGKLARVTAIPLTAGRNLSTLEGTLEELEALARSQNSDDWLRVRVNGKRTPRTVHHVREIFGQRVVAVQTDNHTITRAIQQEPSGDAFEQFVQYLKESEQYDPAVASLFKDLYEAHVGAPITTTVGEAVVAT